jgi:hypothetical protein
MKNNLIAEVYDALGGADGFSRWARSHKAAFYQMYVKTDTPQASQVESDPAELAGLVESALAGVIAARKRDDVNTTATTYVSGHQIPGVTDVAGAANPDGITDTDVNNRPGIASKEVAGPQAQLTSESKSTPESVPTKVSNAKPPSHNAPTIVGINIDALNGPSPGDADMYGRNWSQTRYYGS